MAQRRLTYIQAVNEALRQEMRRDPSIILMGEDIAGGAGREEQGIVDAWGGPFGVTKGLIQEFGAERVRDTPISEMGFIGAAVGAAMTGLRPVVELIFSDFLGVALDQIMNQAAKMRYLLAGEVKVPLVIRTTFGASLTGSQYLGGGTGPQHSQALYAPLVHIPGLKCIAPSNAYHAKGLYAAAIRDDNPVVIFDHKLLYPQHVPVPEEAYTLPIGRAEVRREGRDVTLVGISRMVDVCLEAASALAQEGIQAEVIDLLSLSPLDEEAVLGSLARTKRLVIVDESYPRCSVAGDIAALAADKGFDFLDAPVKTVTSPHAHIPYSSALEELYLPNAARVVAVVKEVMGKE
ncbi:MAG: alpha-ketoacid dehydrogenase subunit beta [Chloroflexi bacterium]|nr:alpha-ketoacid dehydrogenase subunit beta [Chloroflexota bacterium]